MASSTPRKPRKDAQANRAHILAVAGEVFAESGVDVSMDAIAKQAGIGAGTLYRNFPSKDALLAALLVPHHECLLQKMDIIKNDSGDAGQKLQQWVEALTDWMLVYEGLPEPMQAAWCATSSALKPTCEELIGITGSFFEKAKSEGFVRTGLSGEDIFLSVVATAWASGRIKTRANSRNVLSAILKFGWAATAA